MQLRSVYVHIRHPLRYLGSPNALSNDQIDPVAPTSGAFLILSTASCAQEFGFLGRCVKMG